MLELLLDLANIVGGFLLAVGLLEQLPRAGDDIGRFSGRIAPFAWIVGVVALVTGGYFTLVHLISGPHLFHYEVVALIVGVLLLYGRLKGRVLRDGPPRSSARGAGLVLAIFGLIAIIVGIQGLFTPN